MTCRRGGNAGWLERVLRREPLQEVRVQAVAELDRQVAALVSHDVPRLSGMSKREFRTAFDHLVPLLTSISMDGGSGRPAGEVTFVAIPPPHTIDAAQLIPRLTVLGKDRPGVLDRNHGEKGVSDYRPLPQLGVPATSAYLLVGIERGEEFCGVRPRDAVEVITDRRRSPLTILEGIVLQLLYPALLQPNRCFMLAGSRRGDKRVPALWISGGAPKLGWCWEGNPHSWLGTASAERRLSA